ncbi:hypothetical protein Vafri_19758 [Volvox africanus]|uniref:AB hydrolase-1 domain-containing protein n=1 Tax=Volvox africanus TaxID=51714 RepID=A0A8J4BPQ1_9CHLO|nr:hypothetical protein Vafri_19758 [Volvox africanus]
MLRRCLLSTAISASVIIMETTSQLQVLDNGSKAKEFCKTDQIISLPNGITMAYQVYELQHGVRVGAGMTVPTENISSKEKILMVMGFAASGAAWLPTVKELFSRGDKVADLEVAVFDNRGIGQSSCPSSKTQYTTDIMAADALALMDHLGWRKAHVVGHSMGAMIASRLTLQAPGRVASLTLISTTGGGKEAIPLNVRALVAGLKGAFARGRTFDPVKRAKADLAFHFSPKLLKTRDPVTGRSVRDLLVEEYVAVSKETGPQSREGEEGHLNAVMTHKLTASERQQLATLGIPIKLIHGSEDILAELRHARRLARDLRAPLVVVDGAHFIPRDCAHQIVDELLNTIEVVRQGGTHADAVYPAFDEATCFSRCFCCA